MKETSLRFRTPDDSDAEWATAVYNAANPDAPRDLSFTRWLWAITDEDWGERRYVVELDRQPLGWLMLDHVVWNKNPGRFAGVDPWLHPKLQTRPRLDEIFALIEHDAREIGAAVLTTGVREIATRMIRVLLHRGYSKVGTERYWELDLSAHRDRLLTSAAAVRTGIEKKGFHLLTLEEDSSAELEDDLYACYNEARQDMPSTEPYVPWTRELFREWLNDPRKRRDRFWIARSGDRIAGISVLTYPESSAGVVSTNWTGTGRDFRGLGLARSLKLQTLAQAIELGITRVRTDNDSTNAAILHLNKELGYTELPGHVKLRLAL